tara:strand:+ start:477 stop:1052 length:576 start_codon:yes stop_codon:yes gene_type:complete
MTVNETDKTELRRRFVDIQESLLSAFENVYFLMGIEKALYNSSAPDLQAATISHIQVNGYFSLIVTTHTLWDKGRNKSSIFRMLIDLEPYDKSMIKEAREKLERVKAVRLKVEDWRHNVIAHRTDKFHEVAKNKPLSLEEIEDLLLSYLDVMHDISHLVDISVGNLHAIGNITEGHAHQLIESMTGRLPKS